MTSKRGRARSWTVVLAVALLAIGIAAPAAEAKKKGKKGGSVDVTTPVNRVVPVAVFIPPTNFTFGSIFSTTSVGKQFKGLRIRDVDVTVQGTGVAQNSVGGAMIWLTAPNGASTTLTGGFSGTFFGPLTLDDETPNQQGFGPAPNCGGVNFLCEPYQGRARPGPDAENYLNVMDNGPVAGIWTLWIYNTSTAANAAYTFNQWRLQVATGKPYLTK